YASLFRSSPFEDLRQIVHFLLAQVELRHGPASWYAQRLSLHPGSQEGLEGRILTTTNEDVAQLRREVGAFTKQAVTANAVVVFPDFLAAHYRLGQLRRVGTLWESLLCVIGQA